METSNNFLNILEKLKEYESILSKDENGDLDEELVKQINSTLDELN